MNDSDKKKFHEIMMAAGEVYNREITKPLLKIYFAALSDLTIRQVNDAVMQHIKSTDTAASFFPKPAEIIKRAFGSDEDGKRRIEDRANMAWSVILGKISSIGSYGNLEIEDKQALAAVKGIGGWQALCMCTYEQLDWKKKEFIRAYDCYERTPVEHLPQGLPGLHDIENHKLEDRKKLAALMEQAEQKLLGDDS